MFKNLNIYQHSTNTDVLCTQGKFFDEEAILGELSEKLKEVRKIRHHAKDVFFLSLYLYYIFLCVKSGSGDSYQHFLKGCRMQAEFGERKGFQGSE